MPSILSQIWSASHFKGPQVNTPALQRHVSLHSPRTTVSPDCRTKERQETETLLGTCGINLCCKKENGPYLVKPSIYLTTTILESLAFTSIKQEAIITLTSLLTWWTFLWVSQASTSWRTGVGTKLIVTVCQTHDCWKNTTLFLLTG